MVAVVDRNPKDGVKIRAAAPARVVGCLVYGHAHALLEQPHRGGEAGKPGADDVDRAWHYKIA